MIVHLGSKIKLLALCLPWFICTSLFADQDHWFFSEQAKQNRDFVKILETAVQPTLKTEFQLPKKNYYFEPQAWQRLWRPLANLAMAAKLNRDPVYLSKARALMMTLCAYEHWGDRESKYLDVGPDAIMPLIQLALALNWLENEMSTVEVQKVKQRLIKQTQAIVDALTLKRPSQWAKIQNESSRSLYLLGIYLTARHLETSHPSLSKRWLALSRIHFEIEKQKFSQSEGGDFQNSYDQLQYDQGLMMFLELDKHHRKSASYLNSPWIRARQTQYPALIYPGFGNALGTLGQGRFGHYGASHLLYLLSSWYKDGYLAHIADGVYAEQARRPREIPLWFCLNEGLKPKKLKRIDRYPETLKFFDSLGRATLKTGWTKKDSMLMFRCGSPLNKGFYESALSGQRGISFHSARPNQGSFDFYTKGYHVITDLTRSKIKTTQDHSTLRVAGTGQMAEGYPVFKKDALLGHDANSQWIGLKQIGKHAVFRGEFASAYPKSLGLKSYDRTLVWIEDNVLLIIDSIELQKKQPMELYFRSLNHELQLNAAGVRQAQTGMNLTAKSFPKAKWKTGVTLQRELNRRSYYAKSVCEAKQWQHVTVIAPAGYAEDLRVKQIEGGLKVTITAWKYELEWKKNDKGPWLILHEDQNLSWKMTGQE